MSKRLASNRRQRALAALVVFTASRLIASPVPPPAQAMMTYSRYPAGAYAYYDGEITRQWGIAGRDSVYSAEWAWEVTQLSTWSNPYACNSCSGAGNRVIWSGYVDGVKFGTLATGTIGCVTYCQLVFDERENWNTTAEWRNSEWLDSRTIATHEFGHWMGLQHTQDFPSTDPSPNEPAIMCADCRGYGVIHRQIRQDDINGAKAARDYLDILSANDSFEYGIQYWGWRAATPGSRTRYCDGGYSSSCYVQFNGTSNSVYQDIAPRGNGYTQGGTRDMVGRGRFRNRSGLAARTVQVVVWNLENNTPVGSQVCNLPTDTSWVDCRTPTFRTDGRMLRVEFYNNTGSNVDLDTAILG